MKRNTKISITCGVMALALVAGSSFAYFTDKENVAASGVAGTVNIDLTSDMNYKNEAGIMNPGDKFDSSFAIENTGNKSIDVRTTITLKSTVPMSDENGQCEFEIYDAADVEFVDGKGYQPRDGAQPIGSIDGTVVGTREFDNDKTITYTIKDYVLNGSGIGAESEEGVDSTGHDYNYVLVFRGDSKNTFQGAGVSVDVLVEAKQHRNTEAGWELVAEDGFTVPAVTEG